MASFVSLSFYSQKSSKESPTSPAAASATPTTPTGTTQTGSSEAGVMLADDSWLASLATAADVSRGADAAFHHEIAFIATIVIFMASLLL